MCLRLYINQQKRTAIKNNNLTDSYAARDAITIDKAMYIKLPRIVIVRIIPPPSFHKAPILHYLLLSHEAS